MFISVYDYGLNTFALKTPCYRRGWLRCFDHLRAPAAHAGAYSRGG